MITQGQLESNYGKTEGEKLFSYLCNKNVGGINNAKGNTFENFFAVYRIAELAAQNLHDTSHLISSQIRVFVDDLVIENTDSHSAHHFQIKDIEKLTWKRGEKVTI